MVMNPLSSQRGFSLMELMIALGMVAVLLGIGVPAMNDFVQASRLSGSSRALVVDFALARNEAALRAQRVTVCTSTDMTSCSNASWNDGRLIFVDNGAVGAVDGGDLVLSQSPALNSAVTTVPAGAAGAFFISYTQTGRLANWGQIRLCTTDHEQRLVNIHRSGSTTLDRTGVTCP